MGNQRKAIDTQKHKIRHAQQLLEQLDKQESHTMISTIVVSELLRDVDLDVQIDLFDVLQKRFIIVPFCARAALECAMISKQHDMKHPKQDLNSFHSNTAIKADWMILATALANGVEILYTEDKALANMAELVKDRIAVEPIPVPIQTDLFEVLDS